MTPGLPLSMCLFFFYSVVAEAQQLAATRVPGGSDHFIEAILSILDLVLNGNFARLGSQPGSLGRSAFFLGKTEPFTVHGAVQPICRC